MNVIYIYILYISEWILSDSSCAFSGTSFLSSLGLPAAALPLILPVIGEFGPLCRQCLFQQIVILKMGKNICLLLYKDRSETHVLIVRDVVVAELDHILQNFWKENRMFFCSKLLLRQQFTSIFRRASIEEISHHSRFQGVDAALLFTKLTHVLDPAPRDSGARHLYNHVDLSKKRKFFNHRRQISEPMIRRRRLGSIPCSVKEN